MPRDNKEAPKNKDITSQKMDEVVAIYKDTESIKETALRADISQVKVRKILITRGLWFSPRSIQIKKLLDAGKSVAEISANLGITPVAVQAYMPYTKAVYGEEDKSDDAVRAEKYRERQTEFKKTKNPSENVQDFLEVNRYLLELAGIDMSKYEKKGDEKMKKTKINPADSKLPEMYNSAPCGHGGEVYRLKLELVGSDKNSLSPEEWKVLQKYGGVKESISREILVSRNSTLHALHFMIQILFGWQHSHLNEFKFCDEDFEKLLSYNGTPALNYLNACGVYFRFPIIDFQDDDWDDDYEEGMSGRTWMKSKYKNLPEFPCVSEEWKENQRKITEFREWLKEKYGMAEDGTEKIYIRPNPFEGFEAKERGEKLEGKVVSLKECTADELFSAIRDLESPDPRALREHLHLGEVFATGVTDLADENGRFEHDKKGEPIGEIIARGDRNRKKKPMYFPKQSQFHTTGMIAEVGLDSLPLTWAIIETEAEQGMEDAEEYKRDVKAFQKLMKDNEERGRRESEDWRPASFNEALYKWQRHFMDSPFNDFMGLYSIPPIANTLYYNYDFGDNWHVRITVEDVYSYTDDWEYGGILADGGRLIDRNVLSEDEETEAAREIKKQLPEDDEALYYDKNRKFIDGELYAQVLSVNNTGNPICVAKDGLNVMDDVGNVGGYINFLHTLHEGEKEERADIKEWARSQGWTGRDTKPENML